MAPDLHRDPCPPDPSAQTSPAVFGPVSPVAKLGWVPMPARDLWPPCPGAFWPPSLPLCPAASAHPFGAKIKAHVCVCPIRVMCVICMMKMSRWRPWGIHLLCFRGHRMVAPPPPPIIAPELLFWEV